MEPTSLTAVFCHRATDREAETWRAQLAPLGRLEFAVSDAAKGLAAAVARLAEARRGDGSAASLEHGLDVFPTAQEADRVPARYWRRAAAAWEKAEAADATVAATEQRGVDARGVAQTARAAWERAVAAFERAERLASAWGRIPAASDLFGADGRLNDRPCAEAELAAALGDLTGPDWAKVRDVLTDPRSPASLDRMHRRLGSAEPRPPWRAALAWRWWLRHRRVKPSDPTRGLMRAAGRDGALNAEERACYDRVAAVLKDTVRASSAVECMSSGLRMQQSRPRRMTQPMLDLKRLSRNCRPLRSGPRKDACPYQALGLRLPTVDFWELLHIDPVQLTQQLSTQGNAE